MAASTIEGAVRIAGALVGGGLALGGGAIGAAVGAGLACSQTIAAIARQPEIEAKARQYFFLTVGLVEAMYFINLLLMVVFVYVFAAKAIKYESEAVVAPAILQRRRAVHTGRDTEANRRPHGTGQRLS